MFEAVSKHKQVKKKKKTKKPGKNLGIAYRDCDLASAHNWKINIRT
jgi:hypothetical protein